MYKQPNQPREWSEDDLVGLVTSLMDTQLQNTFLGLRSILPQKIQPTKLDGSVPADGSSLVYDSAANVVTFGTGSNDDLEYFAFFMGALGQ